MGYKVGAVIVCYFGWLVPAAVVAHFVGLIAASSPRGPLGYPPAETLCVIALILYQFVRALLESPDPKESGIEDLLEAMPGRADPWRDARRAVRRNVGLLMHAMTAVVLLSPFAHAVPVAALACGFLFVLNLLDDALAPNGLPPFGRDPDGNAGSPGPGRWGPPAAGVDRP